MHQHKPGFIAEQFFCRFLPEQPLSEALLIDEPFWDEDDPPLLFRNVVDLIRQEIEQQVDLGEAPFASWLLARLWHLSGGAVQLALNVDPTGSGLADGGNYLAFAVIEDAAGRVLAELQIEGMDIFAQIILTARSVHVSPDDVITALANTLKAQPSQIAPCRIAIADPEQHGQIHEYGWDGSHFLGSYGRHR
ncbi:MAG: hypothetical protein OHK0022_20200 [Roseiflexaceae bacterium]